MQSRLRGRTQKPNQFLVPGLQRLSNLQLTSEKKIVAIVIGETEIGVIGTEIVIEEGAHLDDLQSLRPGVVDLLSRHLLLKEVEVALQENLALDLGPQGRIEKLDDHHHLNVSGVPLHGQPKFMLED